MTDRTAIKLVQFLDQGDGRWKVFVEFLDGTTHESVSMTREQAEESYAMWDALKRFGELQKERKSEGAL